MGDVTHLPEEEPLISGIPVNLVVSQPKTVAHVYVGVSRQGPERASELKDEVEIPLAFAYGDETILVDEIPCRGLEPEL